MDDLAAEFFECCSYNRRYVDDGLISKQVAVDTCQVLAEQGGYVDQLGADTVQALMAVAFASAVGQPSSDYASQLVMQWELADFRDAWRWTSDLPPKREPQQEWPPRRPYTTPGSTRAAFSVVLQSGNADRLAAWLRNHPNDAATLLGQLKRAA